MFCCARVDITKQLMRSKPVNFNQEWKKIKPVVLNLIIYFKNRAYIYLIDDNQINVSVIESA